MTKTLMAEWTTVRRLGPAQRLLALRRMRPDMEDDARLASALPVWTEALSLNEQAAEDDRTFRRAAMERSMHKVRARELDADLDRLVGHVHQVLDGARQVLPDGSAERDEAEQLYDTMFPNGLAAVVQRRYSDQHQMINGMLHAVRDGSGRFVRSVRNAGLAPALSEIERLNTEYGESLSDANPGRTREERQALDSESYQAYARVVVMVLAAYPTEDEAEQQRRNAILAPVRAQEAEARLYRRRRRNEAEAPDALDEIDVPDEDEAQVDGLA